MEATQGMIPKKRALEFITAGHAIFTLVNTRSGRRFTYKSYIPEYSREDLIFIKVLRGQDNGSDYSYLGFLRNEDGVWKFIHGKKSKICADAPCSLAIQHVIHFLGLEEEMPSLEIWHEGRCGRCGRLLTDPESVERGFGPYCASKI